MADIARLTAYPYIVYNAFIHFIKALKKNGSKQKIKPIKSKFNRLITRKNWGIVQANTLRKNIPSKLPITINSALKILLTDNTLARTAAPAPCCIIEYSGTIKDHQKGR